MFRLRYTNKYRNKKAEHNGVSYHSKFEAGYAAGLDIRKKTGDIRSWERQVKIPLDVNGKHIANYFIDFKILHNDGIVEYVEVKGFETDTWRLKWKLFDALYGDDNMVRLTIVK